MKLEGALVVYHRNSIYHFQTLSPRIHPVERVAMRRIVWVYWWGMVQSDLVVEIRRVKNMSKHQFYV
jgi:hypothetical protein